LLVLTRVAKTYDMHGGRAEEESCMEEAKDELEDELVLLPDGLRASKCQRRKMVGQEGSASSREDPRRIDLGEASFESVEIEVSKSQAKPLVDDGPKLHFEDVDDTEKIQSQR
jgi:hypothetical protein